MKDEEIRIYSIKNVTFELNTSQVFANEIVNY